MLRSLGCWLIAVAVWVIPAATGVLVTTQKPEQQDVGAVSALAPAW